VGESARDWQTRSRLRKPPPSVPPGFCRFGSPSVARRYVGASALWGSGESPRQSK